jgi:hypothetical protein
MDHYASSLNDEKGAAMRITAQAAVRQATLTVFLLAVGIVLALAPNTDGNAPKDRARVLLSCPFLRSTART